MTPEEIKIQQSSKICYRIKKDLKTAFSHCKLFIKTDEGTSTESGVFPTESIVAQQFNLGQSNISLSEISKSLIHGILFKSLESYQ